MTRFYLACDRRFRKNSQCHSGFESGKMQKTGTLVTLEHLQKRRKPQYAGQAKGVMKKFNKTSTKNADCEESACDFVLTVFEINGIWYVGNKIRNTKSCMNHMNHLPVDCNHVPSRYGMCPKASVLYSCFRCTSNLTTF